MTNHKTEITKRVLELMPASISLDKALSSWYRNVRSSGGLRLSDVGYQTLQSVDLESWSVSIQDFNNYISKKLLLELDHKMQFPYYLDYKKKQIIFYNSKEAMMANLYGNLTDFLRNYNI